MQMSDYLENQVINHLLRAQAFTPATTIYLALFSDATTDAGGGTEATGGSYARKAVTLAAPSAGVSSNANAQTFINMPAGTWTHAALMDASSGGNMLFHGPLTNPKTTTAGQTVEVAIGELDVSFTVASNATTHLRHLIIDRFLHNQAHTPAAALYLALYADATDVSGGGTEVSGGTYSRKAIAFVAAAAGLTSNDAIVSFSGMPATDVEDIGILDAATLGNMLLHGPVDTPVTTGAGDIIRLPLGDYDLAVR